MLSIKKSKIPGAGKGLFAEKLFKRGDKVVEYLGEIVSWAECLKRNSKMKNGIGTYYFYINERKCIDAQYSVNEFARYANDAAGFVRIEGVRNNSFYQVDKGKAYIVASRNIKIGDEIFVAYGKEYWDALRENDLDKKVKRKKKNVSESLHPAAKRMAQH